VNMKKIVISLCVCIEFDGNPPGQKPARRSPLDDLLERMQTEMQHGRDMVPWRKSDGTKVA